MYIFSVTAKSITASFRVPETQTFHKTLPHPPKTTIIGLIGAALGHSLEDTYKYVIKNDIHVGVYSKSNGAMNDLWNYRKITNKKFEEKDIVERKNYSVLNREYLIDNNFVFIFGAKDLTALTEIRNAFQSPHYVLTMGNSDDLLKICEISEIENIQPQSASQLQYTVLNGDISGEYILEKLDIKNAPITQVIKSPSVYRLPTNFIFDNGIRRGTDYRQFTFVEYPIKLKNPIHVYNINERYIPLL